jgi:hypothetical protein
MTAGRPENRAPVLREDQIERYARHILLPDVGGVGQKRLLAAVVVVELGPDPAAESVALAYLAAAGVGRLVLAGDADGAITDAEVRAGILLGAGDVSRPRIQAITDRIAALNPDVRVERAPAAGPEASIAASPEANTATEGAVHLAPAPPGPPGLRGLPALGPGAGPAAMSGPTAVAGALVRGGARAVRTLSQLVEPDRAIEPS